MSGMHETKASYRGSEARLLHSDALTFLNELKPNSVDLVISSPPYFMGKEYDKSVSVDDFMREHARILTAVVAAVKDGGGICWQVGYHVDRNHIVPLDALIYEAARAHTALKLRNRIIWTFGHGAHANRRFSGLHKNTRVRSTTKDHAKGNGVETRLARTRPIYGTFQTSKQITLKRQIIHANFRLRSYVGSCER